MTIDQQLAAIAAQHPNPRVRLAAAQATGTVKSIEDIRYIIKKAIEENAQPQRK